MGNDEERRKIREAIRGRYAEVSRSAEGKFRYPTGAEGARALGYDDALLSHIPAAMMKSFCGVGNPFLAGTVAAGDAVLDVGCGSGIDLVIAARLAGPAGRARGIDVTPEMVALAAENAAALGLSNAGASEAAVESIPHADESFTLVISNGVLNLSPDKELAFREIARVLAPGGRLQFADIVLEGDRAREGPCTLRAWSD